MSDSVDFQIGELTGRINAIDGNVKALEQRIEVRLANLDANVKVITNAVTSASGSWRAVMWMGAAVAGLATIMAVIIHWVTGK